MFEFYNLDKRKLKSTGLTTTAKYHLSKGDLVVLSSWSGESRDIYKVKEKLLFGTRTIYIVDRIDEETFYLIESFVEDI